jgi:Spy/CpxP family protein refolding chaperone
MRILGILIFAAALAIGQTTAQQTAVIGELESKLATLRTTYAANHPDVVAVMKQLDQAKARLAELRAADAQRQSQDAVLRSQQDQVRALQEQLLARQAEIQAQEAAGIRSETKAASLRVLEAQLQAQQAELRAREKAAILSPQGKMDFYAVERQLAALRAQQAGAATTGAPNLPETWWRNAGMVKQIGLSPAQVKRMDDVFQQSRLKLIDQKAALDREEAILEPLIGAESLDEGRAASQIDRVAQARAELEKTRGRLLLGIRKQMEPEQWRKLNETRFVVEKPSIR